MHIGLNKAIILLFTHETRDGNSIGEHYTDKQIEPAHCKVG